MSNGCNAGFAFKDEENIKHNSCSSKGKCIPKIYLYLRWLFLSVDEGTLDRTVNSSVSYVWNDGFAFKDEENIKYTYCTSKDIAHRVIRSNKQQCIGHRNICHDGSGRQRKQILSAWDLMLRNPSFWTQDRTVKSSVSYKCNDGFAFQYKVKIQHTSCSSKGEWIPEIYLCQLLCPRVPARTNASFLSLHWTVNSSVSYECNDGFAFKDKEKIKHTSCSSKGEWIPEIYFCLSECNDDKIRVELVIFSQMSTMYYKAECTASGKQTAQYDREGRTMVT